METVSVTLPSGVVYVYGTVNDVVSTWTNTGGNVWTTTASSAEDGLYHLDLDIYLSNGTVWEDQTLTIGPGVETEGGYVPTFKGAYFVDPPAVINTPVLLRVYVYDIAEYQLLSGEFYSGEDV